MQNCPNERLSLDRQPISEKRVGVTSKKILGIGKLRCHARRIFVELLNLFLNHDLLFRAVGFLNRRVRVITTVFLAYPANEEYVDAYVYRSRAKAMSWNPCPVGVFLQNGKIGIEFTISNCDKEFVDLANCDKLRRLLERMEEIRGFFRADHKTFAGILPGVFFRRRLVRETPEAEVTVEAVRLAIAKVRFAEQMADDVPVIVLGGRGFIGRKVLAMLPKGITYSVDIVGDNGQNIWPSHLEGKPAILVNISVGSALGQYMDRMWPGMVVLNEVYPEPSEEIAGRLRDIGCRCYHVVGVEAAALPSFPGAYQGGIPCCAAWKAKGMKVLLNQIA